MRWFGKWFGESVIGESHSRLPVHSKLYFMQTLAFLSPGIIVPTRNAALFRWCLENGLKVVEPMTLTTQGLYNQQEPLYMDENAFIRVENHCDCAWLG